MNLLQKIVEFLIPALREWRIEETMAADGEDAISPADAEWMRRRNERARMRYCA